LNSNNNTGKKGEVQLREIGRIFVKKIWWFVAAFLIILAAGILFSVLRTPQYGLTSTIVISSIDSQYYETLMKYFPEKASELTDISNLTESEKIRSDESISNLKERLSFDIERDELENSIYVNSKSRGFLYLTTVYKDKEATYQINDTLLDMYLEDANSKINMAYNDLLSEIDSKMGKILEDIGRLDEDTVKGKEEIERKYETYYRLEESRDILIDNESFFIERIRISRAPELSSVYDYFSVKRDIVFSFFLAIAVGILAAFAANYFQSLKK
jgi:capsular polysaccharide biosynthesis protein